MRWGNTPANNCNGFRLSLGCSGLGSSRQNSKRGCQREALLSWLNETDKITFRLSLQYSNVRFPRTLRTWTAPAGIKVLIGVFINYVNGPCNQQRDGSSPESSRYSEAAYE
jgi:hypothetical protein